MHRPILRSSALCLAVLLAGGLSAQPKVAGTDQKKVRIIIRNEADRSAAARFGSIVDDYGSFVIVQPRFFARNDRRAELMHGAEDAVVQLGGTGLALLELDEGLHTFAEDGDLVDDCGEQEVGDGGIGLDAHAFHLSQI